MINLYKYKFDHVNFEPWTWKPTSKAGPML